MAAGKQKGSAMQWDGMVDAVLNSAYAGWMDQRRMGGITIYIALLCLRIMYVHVLNQLFREYSSLLFSQYRGKPSIPSEKDKEREK